MGGWVVFFGLCFSNSGLSVQVAEQVYLQGYNGTGCFVRNGVLWEEFSMGIKNTRHGIGE